MLRGRSRSPSWWHGAARRFARPSAAAGASGACVSAAPGACVSAAPGAVSADQRGDIDRVIEWLTANPTRAAGVWHLFHTPEFFWTNVDDDEFGWPLDGFPIVGNLPLAFCKAFLHEERPDIFAHDYMHTLHRENGESIRKLFLFATGLDFETRLPDECRKIAICRETVRIRARLIGFRLSKVRPEWFPPNGKLDWSCIGVYRLFPRIVRGKGRLRQVEYDNFRVPIPPEVPIDGKFNLCDNHSDTSARLEFCTDGGILVQYYLRIFFPPDKGPLKHYIGFAGLSRLAESVSQAAQEKMWSNPLDHGMERDLARCAISMGRPGAHR